MQVTLQALAVMLKAELVGNPDQLISGASPIENGKEGTISFLGNSKYEYAIYSTNASAVIVPKNFIPSKEITANLLKVDNVYGSLALLLQKFNIRPKLEGGISSNAIIEPSVEMGEDVTIGHFSVISRNAKIGKGVKIYPQVYIGDGVEIGDHSVIHAGARIHYKCKIGANCIIYSNAVIGSEGFGYAPNANGEYVAIPQLGNVILEDRVEVGANTTIDRATLGATTVRKGVKLDNLIQVGHNVEIDEHTVIAAQTGIAGSTKIGKYCRVGGQVGFVGHLTVADGAQIQAQSGIGGTVKKKNSKLCGYPAIDYANYFRSYVVFKQLPELNKKLRELEKRVKELSKYEERQDI